MKLIIILLISFVLAVPLIAMGADDPTLCFSCPSDRGPIIGSVELPVWDPIKTESGNPELIFSTPFNPIWDPTAPEIMAPVDNLEIYVDGQFAGQVKVLVFRWTGEMKCFDFAYLREYKQFKEVPCQ